MAVKCAEGCPTVLLTEPNVKKDFWCFMLVILANGNNLNLREKKNERCNVDFKPTIIYFLLYFGFFSISCLPVEN